MNEVLDSARPPLAAPTGPPPPPPPGPIAQSVAIGFRAVYVAGLLLLALWLTSNVREVPADSQAVVFRFGRIVRAQEAGLVVAWPRPIEQVELLPGPDRQLSQDVAALPAPTEKSQSLIGPFGPEQAMPQNVSAFLTGDGNVVLLNATLIYRIDDPIAFVLARSHVAAALDRLFRTTSVHVTAGRNLNDFIVVGAANDLSSANPAVIALRSEVRRSFLDTMNARLEALATAGAPLGVHIERIDLTPWLPPEAKTAFDAVLLANQARERGIAVARTDAERRRQAADRERDQLLSAAQATATELVSRANVDTARIFALEKEETPATRQSLLLREYRAEVSEIMNRVGSAILLDPKTGTTFVLPGRRK